MAAQRATAPAVSGVLSMHAKPWTEIQTYTNVSLLSQSGPWISFRWSQETYHRRDETSCTVHCNSHRDSSAKRNSVRGDCQFGDRWDKTLGSWFHWKKTSTHNEVNFLDGREKSDYVWKIGGHTRSSVCESGWREALDCLNCAKATAE